MPLRTRKLWPALALVLLLAGCRGNQRNYLNISGFTQGSTFSITYSDPCNRDLSHAIDSILTLVDTSMSVFNPQSIISRINQNTETQLSPELVEILNLAQEMSQRTQGAFNITVGSISRALGFAGHTAQGIDSARIKELLQNVGMDLFQIDGTRIVKHNPAVTLDLNAIAQGYTADLIAKYLYINNIQNFIVEIGGEIVADGVNKHGVAWVVGVDKPTEGAAPGQNLQAKLSLSNGRGLATSGNYRKFVEIDGQKYSHTIDPATGMPVLNTLLSATVVAPTAAIADALGTAFMVRGLQWSINFVDHNPEIEAYLIYSDSNGTYKTWKSKGLTEVQ